MGKLSFDHGILKGLIAGSGKLSASYGSKYPSLAAIFAGLISLERSFSKEVELDKQLSAWESRGYNVQKFRTLLQRQKAEALDNEFRRLKRDIDESERVISLSLRLPYAERSKLERELKMDPSRVHEIYRKLQQPAGVF